MSNEESQPPAVGAIMAIYSPSLLHLVDLAADASKELNDVSKVDLETVFSMVKEKLERKNV